MSPRPVSQAVARGAIPNYRRLMVSCLWIAAVGCSDPAVREMWADAEAECTAIRAAESWADWDEALGCAIPRPVEACGGGPCTENSCQVGGQCWGNLFNVEQIGGDEYGRRKWLALEGLVERNTRALMVVSRRIVFEECWKDRPEEEIDSSPDCTGKVGYALCCVETDLRGRALRGNFHRDYDLELCEFPRRVGLETAKQANPAPNDCQP